MNAAPPYYIMPYFAAGSLTRYAGKLNADQLQDVAVELASTIASLHSALELHGDFKPDNILVTDDGRLQVGDPLGNGTIFTMLFSENRGGTPGYWAPEVRTGGPISRASDIHSYGATLAHLLTGIRPRDGHPLPLNVAYPRNSKVEDIILACCQTDPNARPSIGEVLSMLAGKRWDDIQSERRERQELLTGCGIAALVVIGIAALSVE
jgi:serine/threonine protein kinase